VVETLAMPMECCSGQCPQKSDVGGLERHRTERHGDRLGRAPAQRGTRHFPLEMSEGQETSIHCFSASRGPVQNKFNKETAGLKQSKRATPPHRPLVKLWGADC